MMSICLNIYLFGCFLIYPSLSTCPACSLSELSSLHEGETSFRQTYRNVQKKALPAIPDDPQPEPQRHCDNRSPEPRRYRDTPPSPQRFRDDRDLEPRRYQEETRRCQEEPLPQRRYSDDPPPSSQSRRVNRNQRQQNHSEEESHHRERYSVKKSVGSLQ